MFGEAKPLTDRGFRWLKIHLANLYGYDKGTFDERCAPAFPASPTHNSSTGIARIGFSGALTIRIA